MGDRRYHLMLALAVFVAAGSALGVLQLLRAVELRGQVRTRPAVVAAVDLEEGRLIRASDVRTIALPEAAVPADAFRHADSVTGRVARVPVFTGEALVPGRLAPIGAGGGLEVKIASGRRAMAVKIDEVAGLSGLIQPNSRVDVLVTLRAEGTNETQQAKLFMSNMRVLSMGSQLERGPDGQPANATTAALEVTPEQAERLAVAANQGKIQLVLRGYGDADTVRTRGASAQDIVRQLEASGSARGTGTPSADAARRRDRERENTMTAARPRPAGKPALASAGVGPALPVVSTSAQSSSASPVRAPRSDSTVIQVFRRDRISQQKIARLDTARRDSTGGHRPFLP